MRAEAAHHCPISVPALLDDDRVTEDVRETRAIYRSVQRRCGGAIGAANFLGGVILFAVVLPLGVTVGTLLSLRMSRVSAAWLLDGRDPIPAELEACLGYPKRQALLEAKLWAAAIVPFAL